MAARVIAVSLLLVVALLYFAFPAIRVDLAIATRILRGADVKGVRIFIVAGSNSPALTAAKLLICRALIPVLPGSHVFQGVAGVFGSLPGLLLSWLGTTAGALVSFLLVKGIVGYSLAARLKRNGSSSYYFFHDRGPLLLFALRLFPFLPADIFAYLAGLTPLRLGGYTLATCASLLPQIILYSIFPEEVPTTVVTAYLIITTLVSLTLMTFLIRDSGYHPRWESILEKKNRYRLAAGGALLVGTFGAILLIPSVASFFGHAYDLLTSADPRDIEGTIGAIRGYLLGFGFWAPVVSTFLMVMQMIIAPIPGQFVTFTNGALFGAWWGTLLSWSSAMLGAAICYWIGKFFGRPVVEVLVGRQSLEKVDRFFQRFGTRAIIVARLIPFVPFDPVSYSAGMTSISFWRFFLATGLGQLPATVVYSWLGQNVVGSIKYIFITFVSVLALTIILSTTKHKFEKSFIGKEAPVAED